MSRRRGAFRPGPPDPDALVIKGRIFLVTLYDHGLNRHFNSAVWSAESWKREMIDVFFRDENVVDSYVFDLSFVRAKNLQPDIFLSRSEVENHF